MANFMKLQYFSQGDNQINYIQNTIIDVLIYFAKHIFVSSSCEVWAYSVWHNISLT